MRVLLVNPYIYDFSAYDLWLRPLGLLYIASVIREYSNAEIFYLDALDRFQWKGSSKSRPDGRGKFPRQVVSKPAIYKNIPRNYSRYGLPVDLFKEKLNSLPAIDLVLMTSLMTYWIDGVKYTKQLIKERFPEAKFILGGIIPTLSGELVKKLLGFDYIVEGYGEEKIFDILHTEGVEIKPHPEFTNPDLLPLPAFDLLSSQKHLPLMTSRGCPFSCTYCASSILNPGFYERSPQNITKEIYHHHQNYGTEHFTIFDDAFLINKHTRFFPVFKEVSQKLNISFHTPNGLHTKEVDRGTADILFKSGFKTLRLSFESTSRRILEKSDRKVSLDMMSWAVQNLLDAGFQKDKLECYLLFGIPGQKKEELFEAIDFVKQTGIIPKLSWYSPVPGTNDYIELQKEGKIPKEIDLLATNKLYYIYENSGFKNSEIEAVSDYAKSV